MTENMEDTMNQPPVVQRVVELDDKRVNHIQGLVEDLKTMVLSIRGDATHRDETLKRLEASNTKIDEALRGNGKEGLISQVTRLSEKMNDIPQMVQDKIDVAALAMNTGKMRAILKEELDKELDKRLAAPGSWSEFRQKYMMPIVLSVVNIIIGALAALILAK